MASQHSKDPGQAAAQYLTTLKDDVKRAIMTQHLATLRTYAARTVAHEDGLSHAEEIDREIRMREYMAIGQSFDLSQKVLVTLLYKGVFNPKPGCECLVCRAGVAE